MDDKTDRIVLLSDVLESIKGRITKKIENETLETLEVFDEIILECILLKKEVFTENDCDECSCSTCHNSSNCGNNGDFCN